MIYPSHYNPGYRGIPLPDFQPGKMVEIQLKKHKLEKLVTNPAEHRHWLQGFTASYKQPGINIYPAQVKSKFKPG